MKKLALFVALLIPVTAHADTQIAAGSTSQLIDVFISDSSSTTGAGLTGLVYNSASLSCYYHRSNSSSATAFTLATMTAGTWATEGFVQISSSNMPGWYQIGIPNAALATGATNVSIQCKGATNMAPMNKVITLLSPNTYGYDGQLAAESGTSLTLASGAIDADDQFAYTAEVAFFDSSGLLSAVSCIVDSTASSEVVVTAEDISALVAVNDNYIIRANSACRNLRPTTAGNTLDVHANGDAEANLTKIDGQLTNGNNATLYLKQLDIQNSAGSAIVANSLGSNGSGITANGHGTGFGIRGIGGATGVGITGVGGATSGAGMTASSTTGSVITVTATAGNGNAVSLTGQGTGAGFLATGGATGNGIKAVGGGTSGAAILTSVTSGNEIDGDLSGSIGSLGTQAKADVNAEVVDTLTVDTYPEPSACLVWPATLKNMWSFLAALGRHKITQSSTTFTAYKDDGSTTLCTSTTSASGSLFTRGELN